MQGLSRGGSRGARRSTRSTLGRRDVGNSVHITRFETQQLIDLARDKSVAAREALTATVTDLFFARGDVLISPGACALE